MSTPAPQAHGSGHEDPNQFALLRQRRFAPFFWTQFSGAANDNLFKFAFTVMVTYQINVAWLQPAMAGLVIGALFILPFLLFSATSGQLADKYDKKVLIRFVKRLEMAIMALAAWGFFSHNVPVLLGCTFLMGLHSTLFGPVKFAYLPQVLNERELTGGNGMVEMGTFVAILLGNVAGGLIIAVPEIGAHHVGFACVGAAIVGRVLAEFIPSLPATDPGLKVNWNPVSETWRNLKLAHQNIVVFRSLLGISWMWFFGAVFLSQFPSLAKEVLHGNEQVASLLLVVFSVGIGIGSLLCEVLSRRHVEIGLVPLGAIGMSVFSIDLYFASRSAAARRDHGPGGLSGAGRALARDAGPGAAVAVCGPVQRAHVRTDPDARPAHAPRAHHRGQQHPQRAVHDRQLADRGRAAGRGLHRAADLPVHRLANAVVAFYIFLLVPEYLLRFVAWVLSRFVYRFKVQGDEYLPAQGSAVLACNHVSFVDAVLLMAASPRPIYFVMDHRIFRIPVLGWLFKLAKAIPVAPYKEDPPNLRGRLRARRAGAARGRPAGHLPRGRHHARRAVAALQGRHRQDPGPCPCRRPGRARDPHGADQPVGLVLQPHRAGRRHGAAVPARPVQPRGAERGRARAARTGAARGPAGARGRSAAGVRRLFDAERQPSIRLQPIDQRLAQRRGGGPDAAGRAAVLQQAHGGLGDHLGGRAVAGVAVARHGHAQAVALGILAEEQHVVVPGLALLARRAFARLGAAVRAQRLVGRHGVGKSLALGAGAGDQHLVVHKVLRRRHGPAGSWSGARCAC
jgi:MFS family permease